MPRTADPALVAALRADLAAADFTVDRLREVLGPVAHGALSRDQVLPAEVITRGSRDPAAILVRLFTLGDPVEAELVDRALPRLSADGVVRLGLGHWEGDALVASVDLRPYGDQAHTWWVVSDQGEAATRAPLAPDHVLGIGAASTTLAQWTPRRRVTRALDLGTGCGVQALHLSTHAAEIVATDISERALDYCALTAALNGQDWDLRAGSLLNAVQGERFELIVSNPPFVITPREAGLPTYEYRDAGGHGDAVVEYLVTGLGAHLEPGGVAQLLGNWEIATGQEWTTRVHEWARASGVDVWVVQREVQDPASYAETWARDGGHHAGTADFNTMYAAWLDDFASREVAAIGFGVMTLQRPAVPRAPFVDLVEVRGPVASPMGPAIAAGLAARTWLAEHSDDDVLDIAWTCPPDVTQERHSRPGDLADAVMVLRQGRGLGRSMPLTTVTAALTSVCDGDLTARQAAAAIAGLLDLDDDAVRTEVVAFLRDAAKDSLLVR